MDNIFLSTDDIVDLPSEDAFNDLVWESALTAALGLNIEPGTEEFITLYKDMKVAFDNGMEYKHQAAFYALTLTQLLLESNRAAVVSSSQDGNDMKESIKHLAKVSYRMLLYIIAVSGPMSSVIMYNDREFDEIKDLNDMFEFPIEPIETKERE